LAKRVDDPSEVDRTDARNRRSLEVELHNVLASVRAAVADWSTVRNVVAGEAARIGEGEGSALLRWLLDRHFTWLGHRIERLDESIVGTGHGILRQAVDRSIGQWLSIVAEGSKSYLERKSSIKSKPNYSDGLPLGWAA
jgi:NAD-specific glutamate dehydrogenase